jgi:hypothetical protein
MSKREERAAQPRRLLLPDTCALAVLPLALLALAAARAQGPVVCETVGGPPGEEVTLHVEILDPEQGQVFVTGGCELPVTLTGTFFVDAPERLMDFYLVVDTSGSTTDCSQANVNENQILCDQDGSDSIYQAELVAAQRFLEQLDPATSRAALITFASTAVLQEPLADLATVWNTLESLRAGYGSGGTLYVPPLDMMRDEVAACLDCFGREQRGLFMSDGEPNNTTDIDRAARDLAARGVVVDTFRLGDFPNPDMLVLIADTTGGTYYPLATPGEILAVLPEIAVLYRFYSRHEGTGEIGAVLADRTAGTFEAPVVLRAGPNRIVLVLTTVGPHPVTLECAIDLFLAIPRPEDIGKALRVIKTPGWPNHLLLSWEGGPDPVPGQDYRVFRSGDREGPFRERDRTADKRVWTQRWPLERVSYYDVRAGNCADDVSYDPYPATTEGLSTCWVPPEVPFLYPVASNLTDPACGNVVSRHPCTPAPPDLSGVERAFSVEVESLGGGLAATLSNPDLFAVIYDSAASCVGWGQSRVEVQTGTPGTYTIVVDSPAGGEGPFDLTVGFW